MKSASVSSASESDTDPEHDPILRMTRPSASVDDEDRQILLDHDDFLETKLPEPAPKSISRPILSLIALAITLLFICLTWGAYRMTKTTHRLGVLSNGTVDFAPTTVLISLDGFRADFLTRNVTPALHQLVQEGVAPAYMLPSFPSLTFPNHFTIVTGLYPESHGIVGNTFWDPELQKEFYYTDPARSMQPEWWAGGEPLWVTAEKTGIPTAVHMWPGSEAGMAFSPTFLDKYNGSEVLERKTHRILDLLDMPHGRPQLIAAYVPNVDAAGHAHGPNSTEIFDTLRQVDDMLRELLDGIARRNLTHVVNVVVVSDHGMATTSVDRLIALDEIIDISLVEHTDGWPLYGLRPFNKIDIEGLYNTLNVASAARNHSFEVYLRDVDMPARYHFAANVRIAPLWVVPKAGWAIVHSKADFDIAAAKAAGTAFEPRGLHGYDHEDPLMRAIFVARGPAFRSSEKRPAVFQNTQVYNLVCDSLLLPPALNNGSLRLPLSYDSAPDDITAGPPNNSEESAPKESKGLLNASAQPPIASGSPQDDGNFWGFMKAKFRHAMDWVHERVG